MIEKNYQMIDISRLIYVMVGDVRSRHDAVIINLRGRVLRTMRD